MNFVIIKKGSVEVKLDRNELVEVSPTPDGVVFNFKQGLQLNLIDTNMPIYTKDIMKNAADGFTSASGNLVFNLVDYNKPAMIDAT
ncbi:unnamed protein product [marine sediment metagenome]|uniref:Uncharacterized protein n=1 Tax=marine sediment metagenome TaxID=412755 RepID=X0XHZ6_9ZZZZ